MSHVPEEHLQRASIVRARQALETSILGKQLDFLSTPEGKSMAKSYAFFSGLEVGELSVVFDEEGKFIYWIGPTSVLPPNVQSSAPAKA